VSVHISESEDEDDEDDDDNVEDDEEGMDDITYGSNAFMKMVFICR
jgi:hypothetical protein